MTTARASIRVLLADDHEMMRQGVRKLLADKPGLEVIADVSDGRTALKLVAELKPDVVVMDVTMPDLNGIEATRQIKSEYPSVQVIGLSMHADKAFVTEMLTVGASGYVLKECTFDELVTAIRAAANHEVYLSPKVAGVVVKGCLDGPGENGRYCGGNLTPREHEILQLVADGKSSKEIAFSLSLSVKTVDTHRRQVMEKLKLFSIAELTHYAIREGVTPLH